MRGTPLTTIEGGAPPLSWSHAKGSAAVADSPAPLRTDESCSLLDNADDDIVLLFEVRDESIDVTDVAGVVDDEQEISVLLTVCEDVVVDLPG